MISRECYGKTVVIVLAAGFLPRRSFTSEEKMSHGNGFAQPSFEKETISIESTLVRFCPMRNVSAYYVRLHNARVVYDPIFSTSALLNYVLPKYQQPKLIELIAVNFGRGMTIEAALDKLRSLEIAPANFCNLADAAIESPGFVTKLGLLVCPDTKFVFNRTPFASFLRSAEDGNFLYLKKSYYGIQWPDNAWFLGTSALS
ncbi:MAG: hypothetical protein WCT43_04100 [Candidatus Magasanikbacteria bacterium]